MNSDDDDYVKNEDDHKKHVEYLSEADNKLDEGDHDDFPLNQLPGQLNGGGTKGPAEKSVNHILLDTMRYPKICTKLWVNIQSTTRWKAYTIAIFLYFFYRQYSWTNHNESTNLYIVQKAIKWVCTTLD